MQRAVTPLDSGGANGVLSTLILVKNAMCSINCNRVYGNVTVPNGALPSFNDDGPFAVRSLPVIVWVYLSMKRSRPAGVQQTSEATEGAVALESIFKAQRLSQTTVCSHFDDNCVIRGAGHLVVQRQSCCKVPVSIPPILVQFNGTAAQRSLLMAPSNPLFLKEAHTQRAGCGFVRVCRTGLSVPSHTPVVTVIPGSKIGPVARQPCHPRSWPISILHLEERGLRTLRQSQVDKKTTIVHPACHGAKTKLRIFMIPQKCPPSATGCLFLRSFAEFMLVSLINTQSDINTAHPGDQETAPLRAEPHFDWLPWSSWWGNSYQGSLLLCNANPAPVVAMIVLVFGAYVWLSGGGGKRKDDG